MIKFIYEPDNDSPKFMDQLSPSNFICDITIEDASYSLDAQGYVYPKISVQGPEYMAYTYNQLRALGTDGCVKIYVQGDIVRQYDRYSVYAIDDVDPHDYSYGLYWKFKSSIYANSNGRFISLSNAPSVCPVCGDPLSRSDELWCSEASNILQCRNIGCWCHKYTAIKRFLIVSCKLPQLYPIFKKYVDALVVKLPSDLYKLDIYDSLYSYEDISSMLEQLAETRGNISLSDYLMSLPMIDYEDSGFRINPYSVSSDFTPSGFIEYIYMLTNKYVEYLDTYDFPHGYRSWIEGYSVDVLPYMSISAFFEYAKYFYKNDSNIREFNELSDLGVFKHQRFVF